MPYVPGGTPEPESELPKPSLTGFIIRDRQGQVQGATMYATRYGQRFRYDIKGPNGLLTLMDAAALVHRRDPKSGEWRPVARLSVYRWVNEGKLKVRRAKHPGSALPVMKVRASELWHFAEVHGFRIPERTPEADQAARR